MADADIIPIGSGGRPGRGSGRRTTPSAAARALAGPGARPKKPKAKPAEVDETVTELPPLADGQTSEPADTDRSSSTRTQGRGPDLAALAGLAGLDFAAFEKVVRETLGADGERKVAELLAFLRRRLTGEYEVDEFGYDSDLTDQVLLSVLRPLAEKWFRVEVRGIENIPDTGSALIVANHSGTMPLDGLITQLVVADHTNRPLRTLAADLVFRTPFVGEMVPQGRRDAGQQRRRRAPAPPGQPGRRLAGGLQGTRQAVQRAVQAAAVRPRRIRQRGHADRRTDRAVLDRRRRGDLPAGRQPRVAGPAGGRPVHPGHAVLPAARARSA